MDSRKTQGKDAEDAMKRYHSERDTRWPQIRRGGCPHFAVNVMVNHIFALLVSMKNMSHNKKNCICIIEFSSS